MGRWERGDSIEGVYMEDKRAGSGEERERLIACARESAERYGEGREIDSKERQGDRPNGNKK